MRIRIVWKPRTRAGAGVPFLSPLPVPVRSAVLSPGFAATSSVRVFGDGWSREVEDYGPRLLAAPLTELRHIAARAAMRRISLPSLDCAVVAFTGAGHPALTLSDRDFFWRLFQVPLFEQFLGPEGRALAAECDAHVGLHILTETAALAGFAGLIETAPCPCGRPGPRVIGVRDSARRPPVLTTAASA